MGAGPSRHPYVCGGSIEMVVPNQQADGLLLQEGGVLTAVFSRGAALSAPVPVAVGNTGGGRDSARPLLVVGEMAVD